MVEFGLYHEEEQYILGLEIANSPSIVPPIDTLLNRIDELETELGMKVDVPPEFRIPRNMNALLGMLMKREIVTREGAVMAIYAGMPNTWDKEPDPKIIDVFICKLRTRLKKYGIKVSCKWGLGYFMDGENKRKLRELIAQSRAEAGE
jgi:two-component system, cell cycle response regulator CtrA